MLLFDSCSQTIPPALFQIIPNAMRDTFFTEQYLKNVMTLSDTEISLLQQPLAKGIDILQTLNMRLLSERQKIRLWLCATLSHSQITDEMLMQLISILELTPEIQIKVLVLSGRIALLKPLLANHSEIKNIFLENECELFYLAAANGHLAIIELFLTYLPEEIETMIAARNYGPFCIAAVGGHLEVMKKLMEQAPDCAHAMVLAGKYQAFYNAAAYGHTAIIDWLIERAPDRSQTIINHIMQPDYSAFEAAILNGRLGTLNRLIELVSDTPEKLHEILSWGGCYFFRSAIDSGHLDMFNRLIELNTPDMLSSVFSKSRALLFHRAARGGNLDIIKRLSALNSEHIQKMISWDNYICFFDAAANGHLAMMNWLIDTIIPEKLPRMIAAKDYKALRNASEFGHLDVVNRLVELTAPEQIQAMIAAGEDTIIASEEYEAFLNAATCGNIELLNRLIELVAPEKKQTMIATKGYQAFRDAAFSPYPEATIDFFLTHVSPENKSKMITSQGILYNFTYSSLAILNRFVEITTPQELAELIENSIYESFDKAAKSGNLEAMERLILLAPNKTQEMISHSQYHALYQAAEAGHLAVVKRLIELVSPEEMEAMLVNRSWSPLNVSAKKGHWAVFNHIVESIPVGRLYSVLSNADVLVNSLDGGNFNITERIVALVPSLIPAMLPNCFLCIARCGYLTMLNRFLALIPPIQIKTILTTSLGAVFENAVQTQQLGIINRLLLLPYVFAFVEQHVREYGASYVNPFIAGKISVLRSQRQAVEIAHPNAVFDVNEPEKTQLYFYMIRNLIRRNDRNLDDDLRFLLAIPSVKMIAHSEVTPGNPNELIRLALAIENEEAAAILLNISAVRLLAEQHDFYRNETSVGLDLRALAIDRESSMNALTTGERKRFDEVINLYIPLVRKTGVGQIMNDLRDELITRYKKKPAQLVRGDEVINLPMDWESFQAITLTDEERKRALTAYYNHREHSAFRYLLKPNPWMAPNALYVEENLHNPFERWSSFEEYQSEICLFFLAVIDTQIPPTDDHTFKGRLKHFINELALIGRAHNWDQTRLVINSAGESALEEYDNGKGDMPSCYSGVKRRLFQSVIGHPLLKVLAEDGIRQELRDFVRHHVSSLINDTNRELFKKAMDDFIVNVDYEEAIILKQLDITAEQQQQFIDYMAAKYGAQFNDSPQFQQFIRKQFTLSHPSHSHVQNFSALIGFDKLLNAATSKPSQGGIFGASNAQSQQLNECVAASSSCYEQ